jgi:hypothetical protein
MEPIKPFAPVDPQNNPEFTAPTDLKFKRILSKPWLYTIFGLLVVIAFVVVAYYIVQIV